MATGAQKESPLAVSIEEFQDKLVKYGPDLAAWPDPEREAARKLLAKSEYAREMRAIEALLKKELGAKKIVAPKGLADRIVERARDMKIGKSKP